MVNPVYTQFKGVTNIGNTMLMNELENNMKTFLDWCFLNVGAFVNVELPTTSAFGGNFHTLYAADDPNYSDRQVFETIRKDWVWETGASFSGVSPIQISGVYINNQYFGTGDATYNHHYDYLNGRVIFSGAVPDGSGVTMEYSYRWIQTYISDRAEWFYNPNFESLRPADNQWDTYYPSSGDFSLPPQHRVQFPAIIIESVPRADARGWELGNGALLINQDVLFHVVAETKSDRNTLLDVLRMQEDRVIYLYDTDKVVQANVMPLDYRNMIANSGSTYPVLVDSYRFTACFIKDISISSVESLNPLLHEGTVRMTMELVVDQF